MAYHVPIIRREYTTNFKRQGNVKIMQQDEDPRKRPLLTAAQLQIMRRVPDRPKKGNPREEFEKLFRRPIQ